MTEIRTIRPEEAEPFLRLLCEVFGLDFDRARGIFFTEPMFDLRRKWALFEDSEMLSILTTVPLQFGWGKAIGIAGVATREDHRRRGLAQCLLETVLQESAGRGEKGALLFARETTVYERTGFQAIDQVVRASIRVSPETSVPHALDGEEIARIYAAWSERDPARLRRDEQRWAYWKWNLRVCSPFGGGYICTEGTSVRECVLNERVAEWPLPSSAEWLGLDSMARLLEIPLKAPIVELQLMARGVPLPPQMFMTDQF
jgi:GNAT superfamily N-acetyltransferase